MGVFSRSRPSRDPADLPPPPSSPDASSETSTRPNAPLPDEPPTAAPSQPPSRSLRFLSRLTSASSSAVSSSSSSSQAMPRTIADFHIRPDKPYHTYAAGDHVRGSVVLAIVKPVRITHLVVALHGSVRVFRSAADGVKAKALPAPSPSGSARRPQYHGNGQASLFQDEQVLSGEGRLEPQRYEFQFNLKFPEKPLPSSVDFERGSISYVITATLTRPISIKATITCDRLIRLEEKVDIGSVPPPRSRTIFLEPIPKGSRRKKPQSTSGKLQKAIDGAESGSISDRDAESSSVREGGVLRAGSELNDTQSVMSADSARSASTAPSSRNESSLKILASSGLPSSASAIQELDDKTITATVELLRGGCLPGEMVPVKITVQHIKPIKSMHGIIVTLYREARINPSPPTSLFNGTSPAPDSSPTPPKSRSSLPGLSRVSSSSKASSFRKDLSQSVGPLLIDPVTLSTSVTVAVRVPEDSFPTMKRVPGEMISFRYQVEVIADLGGRLANQFQSAQQSSRVNTFMNSNQSNDMKVFNSWGGTIINTTNMSRERGVTVVNLEVVVGTMNSGKQQHPPQRETKAIVALRPSQVSVTEGEVNDLELPGRNMAEFNSTTTPIPPVGYFGPPPGDPPPGALQSPQARQPSPPQLGNAPEYVRPPQIPDESGLTEKERIQRAEQRLLPSQPPSAPPLSEAGPSAPPAFMMPESAPARGPSAPSAPSPGDVIAGPSAPPPFDPNDNMEDKQEVERRRLLAEASAPPEMPEDADNTGLGAGASVPTEADLEPTAPVLVEDQYGGQYSFRPEHAHDGPEPLPRYER